MTDGEIKDDAGNSLPTPAEWFAGARPLTDRVRELEAALVELIDACESGDLQRIETAMFVGRGLTF